MTRHLVTVTKVGIATIQDGGRPGRADVGVPVSGAWHRQRYDVASALVAGVADGSVPAAELLAGSLRLHVEAPVDLVVVGPASVTVNAQPAPVSTVIEVRGDDVIDVHGLAGGPSYVTVAGWQAAKVLGSASFDSFSALGQGPIAVGDSWHGTSSDHSRLGCFARPVADRVGPIRVVAVMDELAREFVSRTWRVHSLARSGLRLRAEHWQAPTHTIASGPVVPGAVQLTPDGEAIVLGPDGALTGGYPVVAVVASVDLDRLSTLSSDGEVSFEIVAVAEAVAAFHGRPRPVIAHPSALA